MSILILFSILGGKFPVLILSIMVGIYFSKWSLSSGRHAIYAYFSVSSYVSEY